MSKTKPPRSLANPPKFRIVGRFDPKAVLSKPPKPVNQMTDAELDAWVDAIYNGLAAQQTPPASTTTR